jgi:hypothetical protein
MPIGLNKEGGLVLDHKQVRVPQSGFSADKRPRHRMEAVELIESSDWDGIVDSLDVIDRELAKAPIWWWFMLTRLSE